MGKTEKTGSPRGADEYESSQVQACRGGWHATLG